MTPTPAVPSMAIVHVMTKGDVGGAQTHVVELAIAQAGRGHRPALVVGSGGPAVDRLLAAGVPVRVVPSLLASRARVWQAEALRDVRVAIDALAPDIVHGHSSNGGLLARLASRRDGRACVYTAHGWPFQRGAPLSQRVKSFMGEFVGGLAGDAVICLTGAEARRAIRSGVVRRRNLWVVPNGLSDVSVPTGHSSGDIANTTGPALVMVARFAPPKLQTDVLDVLAGLLDLPWSMTFVGDGPELDTAVARGRELLGDRVEFLGHRDDVDVVLAGSDVALLWSRYEGMPIALLEAMRAGLCCVASDLPGVRSLFGEPSAGLIAADVTELRSVLRSVIGSPGERRAFGERARRRFEEAFSIDAMERATQEVYDEVLARRVSGRRRSPGAGPSTR
ncbi:MAG: glycosyltransferase [Ilumatobacteraceae bacterium]